MVQTPQPGSEKTRCILIVANVHHNNKDAIKIESSPEGVDGPLPGVTEWKQNDDGQGPTTAAATAGRAGGRYRLVSEFQGKEPSEFQGKEPSKFQGKEPSEIQARSHTAQARAHHDPTRTYTLLGADAAPTRLMTPTLFFVWGRYPRTPPF